MFNWQHAEIADVLKLAIFDVVISKQGNVSCNLLRAFEVVSRPDTITTASSTSDVLMGWLTLQQTATFVQPAVCF